MLEVRGLLAEALAQVVAIDRRGADPSAAWWLVRDPSGDEGRREVIFRLDLETEMRKFAEEAGVSYEAAMAEVDALIAEVKAKEQAATTRHGPSRASGW